MHDAITLGIPVLVILFGILFNRQGLSELKADNKQGLSELNDHRLKAGGLSCDWKSPVCG